MDSTAARPSSSPPLRRSNANRRPSVDEKIFGRLHQGEKSAGAAIRPPVAGRRQRRNSYDDNNVDKVAAAARWAASPEGKRRTQQRQSTRKLGKKSPLWMQGNAAMDAPEVLAARKALRYHADVVQVLDKWWAATDTDGNGEIDKVEYIELGKALYRVIIGDGDELAARRSAEDDWAEDSRGADVMTPERFRDAIFQLADLYTEGVEPSEYVSFLTELLAKMKRAGLGQDLLQKAKTLAALASGRPTVNSSSAASLSRKESQLQLAAAKDLGGSGHSSGSGSTGISSGVQFDAGASPALKGRHGRRRAASYDFSADGGATFSALAAPEAPAPLQQSSGVTGVTTSSSTATSPAQQSERDVDVGSAKTLAKAATEMAVSAVLASLSRTPISDEAERPSTAWVDPDSWEPLVAPRQPTPPAPTTASGPAAERFARADAAITKARQLLSKERPIWFEPPAPAAPVASVSASARATVSNRPAPPSNAPAPAAPMPAQPTAASARIRSAHPSHEGRAARPLLPTTSAALNVHSRATVAPKVYDSTQTMAKGQAEAEELKRQFYGKLPIKSVAGAPATRSLPGGVGSMSRRSSREIAPSVNLNEFFVGPPPPLRTH